MNYCRVSEAVINGRGVKTSKIAGALKDVLRFCKLNRDLVIGKIHTKASALIEPLSIAREVNDQHGFYDVLIIPIR